jgi:hypothetical protein
MSKDNGREKGWISTAAKREDGDATWRVQIKRALQTAAKHSVELAWDLRKAFDHVRRSEVVECGRWHRYTEIQMVALGRHHG